MMDRGNFLQILGLITLLMVDQEPLGEVSISVVVFSSLGFLCFLCWPMLGFSIFWIQGICRVVRDMSSLIKTELLLSCV